MNTTNLTHKTGEHVVYKKHGVYEIAEIRREKISGEVKTYYILKSVYDANSTVYVPADKDELVSQMERVLSAQEIETIIDNSKTVQMEWIDSNSERFDVCEKILAQGDLSRILALLKLLMQKKQEALNTKNKIFAHDERMLTASQKIISEAFAFSLGIDKKDVVAYIFGSFLNSEK